MHHGGLSDGMEGAWLPGVMLEWAMQQSSHTKQAPSRTPSIFSSYISPLHNILGNYHMSRWHSPHGKHQWAQRPLSTQDLHHTFAAKVGFFHGNPRFHTTSVVWNLRLTQKIPIFWVNPRYHINLQLLCEIWDEHRKLQPIHRRKSRHIASAHYSVICQSSQI